jgi:hypothetical protein
MSVSLTKWGARILKETRLDRQYNIEGKELTLTTLIILPKRLEGGVQSARAVDDDWRHR